MIYQFSNLAPVRFASLMRTCWGLLSGLLCLFLGARLSAEEPAILMGDPPNYRAYFLTTLDLLRNKPLAKTSNFLRDNEHLHIVSLAAAAEVRAWQWTARAEYAKSAVERMRLLLAKQTDFREVDFFTPYPLTFAWRGLANSEFVDAELKQAMQTFAAQKFVPRDDISLNNQTIIRACGLELAAQQWPDLPAAEKWHAYALKIAELISRTEDIPENAPNYNSLDLVGLFLLSDLLQQPELLTKPGIRAMFERYRDQVTPAGWIPPYGDSGSAPRPFQAAWPMKSPWAHYVAAFERAAREYQSPSLRWAGLHMANAGPRMQPLGKEYSDIESIFYLSFADAWQAAQVAPQLPNTASAVLNRRDFTTVSAWDKLILNPSRAAGKPFVLCDLYARGYHGHVNQHGGISYFEAENYPLLTVLGYNSRDPEHTNLVMLRAAEDSFPHVPGIFTPEEWHTAQLPTERLPVIDTQQPFLRRIEHVNLRVDAGKRGVTLWADALQLQSPTQPPRVLDDFDAVSTWRGKPTLSDDVSPEALPSKHSLRWEILPGTKFIEKRGVNQEFDCREFPTLSFRWKLSNSDERSRPIIMRITSQQQTVDFHAHAIQLAPKLVETKAEQRGDDQFGVMAFEGWFTPDTRLRRQMVLTKSGVLLVRDVLSPGPMARGQVAGPIWHMGSTLEPTQTEHWFNSTGGKLDLLTWYEPAAERQFGRQTVAVWSKPIQHTLFAKQRLQPDQPLCFVSILVPHRSEFEAAALAKQIQAVSTREKTSITLRLPWEAAEIEIDQHDRWQIVR